MEIGDFVIAKYPLIDGEGIGIVLESRRAFKFGYDFKVYWSKSKKTGWVRGYNLERFKDMEL